MNLIRASVSSRTRCWWFRLSTLQQWRWRNRGPERCNFHSKLAEKYYTRWYSRRFFDGRTDQGKRSDLQLAAFMEDIHSDQWPIGWAENLDLQRSNDWRRERTSNSHLRWRRNSSESDFGIQRYWRCSALAHLPFFFSLEQHISSLNSVVRVQLAQRRTRNNDRGGFNNNRGQPRPTFLLFLSNSLLRRLSWWSQQSRWR